MKRTRADLAIPLAYLDTEDEAGQAYLREMRLALDYAFENKSHAEGYCYQRQNRLGD